MSTFAKLLILVSFFACSNGLALAQGGATGAITGTVQDPSGGVIASAKVEIVSEATGQVVRDLTTDSSGSFTATLLPVGSYSVGVSAAGFATTKFTGVLVRVTETTRMTAALKVTQTTETVTVSAEVATINTADADNGGSPRCYNGFHPASPNSKFSAVALTLDGRVFGYQQCRRLGPRQCEDRGEWPARDQ